MSTVPYLFVLLAIVAVAGADLVCPGHAFILPRSSCVNECSSDKDTCGTGKKCCYTPQPPCGYRCLDAKNNIIKAGKCPSRSSEQKHRYWNLCDGHFCDVDNDCRRKRKCCPNMCGTKLCIAPQ